MFRVTGHIAESADQDGVHGLLVEVRDRDSIVDGRLGATRTNEDGAFGVTITEAEYADRVEGVVDTPPELFVTVVDRDGHTVHSTEQTPQRCAAGEEIEFELELDPDAVASHLSRPTTWERSGGRLVPDGFRDDIEAAVRMLASPGETEYREIHDAAFCPDWELARFDTVLDDAWRSLQGDLAAAEQLRRTLETVYAYGDGEIELPESGTAFVDGSESNPGNDVTEQRREGNLPLRSPDGISLEKAVPLFVASATVGGSRRAASRFAGITFWQVCKGGLFGAVHAAAVNALEGGERQRRRWRNTVDLLAEKCGPADRPRFCLDPPVQSEEGSAMGRCVQEAIRAGPDPYVITDVSPPQACPGEQITIRGRGFGDDPGAVIFGGGLRVAVENSDWTDTRIDVSVPENAGCGVELRTSPITKEICDRFITFRKSGRKEADFVGAAAQIEHLYVNGRPNVVHVMRDDDLRVSWGTCATDYVRIEIDDEDGERLAERDPAAPSGSWSLELSDFEGTFRELTVRVVAEGECSPSQRDKTARAVVHYPSPSEFDESWPMLQHDVARTGHHPTATGSLVARSPRWTFFAHVVPHKTSPAVVDGTVYVGSVDSNLYALDEASGTEKWRFEADGRPNSSPAVVDDTVYVGSNEGKLYALEAGDGGKRWEFDASERPGSGNTPASPAVVDDTVFLGGTFYKFYALDAASGDTIWETEFESDGSVAPGLSSPAVDDDTVYVVAAPHTDRKVIALDATTGDTRWEFETAELESDIRVDGGGTSPTLADGNLYVGGATDPYDRREGARDRPGRLLALDAATGDVDWEFEFGPGENVDSSAAVADGTVYVNTTDGTVYAFDATAGTKSWEFTVHGEAPFRGISPTVVDGIVYVTGAHYKVYALDSTTGEKIWAVDLEGPGVRGTPVVVNSTVYVTDLTNGLYALD